jgi:hypothetical protein
MHSIVCSLAHLFSCAQHCLFASTFVILCTALSVREHICYPMHSIVCSLAHLLSYAQHFLFASKFVILRIAFSFHRDITYPVQNTFCSPAHFWYYALQFLFTRTVVILCTALSRILQRSLNIPFDYTIIIYLKRFFQFILHLQPHQSKLFELLIASLSKQTLC